jgi:hypothetical protein
MNGMAQRKKPDAATHPARSGANINANVDEDIRAQMDAFIADHNAKDEHPASVRSTVEAALKAYLREKGFWPPKGR